MSDAIDRRIVDMQFNNDKFESGIQESVKSLDNLKKGLNLTESTRNLQSLGAASKSFSLGGIATGVEHISSSFSAMGVVGFTILQNLTTQVIEFGIQAAKAALGIDSIMGGFGEYEQGLSSFQTIVANTKSSGATIDDVNKAMAELNTYANQTIFSYGDMTKAIGLFTAQGVKLEDSVTAIKGIFNLVALTGGDANKANSAIYQLSQGLASGVIRLQDWISVINAGIGGNDFQNALKMAAKAHGVAVDDMIKKEGSFRESLKNGWLTSEILLETLSFYTGDLTAEQIKAMTDVTTNAQNQQVKTWAISTQAQLNSMQLTQDQLKKLGSTWQTQANALSQMSAKELLAFGLTTEQIAKLGQAAANSKTIPYTEEQIALIQQLGKTANDSATKLKSYSQVVEMLKSNMITSWAQSFKIVLGNLDESIVLWSYIGNTISGVLQGSADARNAMLQQWKDLGGRTMIFQSLKDVFQSLLDIGRAVKDAFSDVFPPSGVTILITATNAISQFTSKLKVSTTATWTIFSIFKELFSVFKFLIDQVYSFTYAFREIFPINTANIIDSIVNAFHGLANAVVKITSIFKLSWETNYKLLTIYKAFWAIIDIVRIGVIALVKGIGSLVSGIINLYGGVDKVGGAFGKFLGNILDGTFNIANFIMKLRENIKTNDLFGKSFNKINEFILNAIPKISTFVSTFVNEFEKLISKVTPIFDSIKNFLGNSFKGVNTSGIESFASKIGDRFSGLKTLFTGLGKIWEWFIGILQKLAPLFGSIASGVGNLISGLADALANGLSNIDYGKVFDGLSTGLLAALVLAIKKFVDNSGSILTGGGGLLKDLSGILGGVKDSLTAWQNELKAKTLLEIAGAIAILAVSLIAISLIEPSKLVGSIAAISALFASLTVALGSLNKTSGVSSLSGSLGQISLSAQLVALATSIAIISGAVALLASLDPKKVMQGIISVGTLLTELVVFMKATDINKMGIEKSAGILVLATSLSVMAGAVALFGVMDPTRLLQGLAGVGGVLGELAIFVAATGDAKKVISTAIGLTIIASAMILFSVSLERIGKIPLENLRNGLIGLGGALLAVAIAMKIMPPTSIFSGIGLLAAAEAMVILTQALIPMSQLSWEEIGKGMAFLGGSMLILGIALNALVGGLPGAAAILVVAPALVILAQSMQMMAKLTWEEIGKGMAIIAGSMLIFGVALNAMIAAAPGAAAVLVVAAALAILTPVLKVLGSMSLEQIGTALLAMAGVFAVIGVAGLLLGPLSPVILALASALLIFGQACLSIGSGMLLFSLALGTLAITGAAGAAAIVVIVQKLLSLIPMAITALVGGIVLFAKLISEAASPLATAITVTLLAVIAAIVAIVPPLVDAIILLITTILQKIAEGLPAIIQAGFDIIMALLKGIRDNIGGVVEVVGDIIVNFIEGIATEIPKIIQSAFDLVISFITGLADAIDKNKDRLDVAIGKLVNAIINGLVNGIKNGVSAVWDAITNLGNEALNALKRLLGIRSPSKAFQELGEYSTEGFVNGLMRYGSRVGDAAGELGNDVLSTLTSVVSQVSDAFNSELSMDPTIRPVVDLSDVVASSRQASRMFGTVNMMASVNRLASVASGMSTSKYADSQINQNGSQGMNISLTQNNYSPESLSRYELYRQQRRLLEELKGKLPIK